MSPPIPLLSDYAAVAARLAHRLSSEPAGRPPDQPLVSVITVCRNAAATLPACLASVRAQSYPWIEHLVIDGDSSDGTIALLERSTHLAAWVSEPDEGISDAFNKGVALSRGSIVGILNADDQYLPDAVARAVAALNSQPQAGFAFGGCEFTLDGRVVLHHSGDPRYARCIARQMPVINHPTVFVRKECYARLGIFRRDLRLAMDYDLLLRFHLAGITGHCVAHTLVRMALGGASTRHLLRAHAEAMRVSIDHGRPRALALMTFCRTTFIPLLRSIATLIGLRALWLTLRARARAART